MKRKKIQSPVHRGVAKVPMVMQMEALECGAACLDMIAAYYDLWIPLEKVRMDCGVSRDGSSAINLIKAARSYGLEARGFKMEPEELKADGHFPCIVHWNFNHFVVVCGIKGDRIYLNDPAKGSYTVSPEMFDEGFTGVCIQFEPGENFRPGGSRKSMAAFVKKRVKGLKHHILFAALITVLSSILGILAPGFDKFFYDRLLTGKNPEWFRPFLYLLVILYFLEIVMFCVSTATDYKLKGKLSILGSISYMWKVLYLPMHFFSQRMTGDILAREEGNAQISDTLVTVLAPVLMNGVMMIFYLVVMSRYSRVLTLIGVVTVVLNVGITRWSAAKRVNLTRVQARDRGKLSAITVSGIQMIESIKSSGAEAGFFEKWSGNYAAVNSSTQKYIQIGYLLNLIPLVISSVSGTLILGIGIYLTICGSFTLGSIAAFQGLYLTFMNPVTQLINAGQTIQEMRTQMERIDDVLEYPEDPNMVEQETLPNGTVEKLTGNIEIRNLTFGYAPLGNPLIENFNMTIRRGSRVAFVGASGCGKSTLSKLISGLYVPWSGEIRYDGKLIREIDHRVFTGSLAVVDQEIVLFRDTVENNIKMWDNSIQHFEMVMAARDASLHYDIMARPEGYQHVMTEDGRDFSGGQRQRMEIARVLAQEPNIIILDEATSALDAKTEYEVVQSIKDRGITCIVIAHRLSTIRDCDEIVVLDHGKVVERGTHAELMAIGGHYSQLITNE